MYLVDIIKDSIQLALLIISIGGINNFLSNPSSFSSTVSKHSKKQMENDIYLFPYLSKIDNSVHIFDYPDSNVCFCYN